MLLAFCGRAHCWLHFNFLLTCTLGYSLWWFSSVCWCVMLFFSRFRAFYFPFVLLPFPSSLFKPFSSLSMSLCQAVHTPSASVILSSFVSSANMLGVQCVPSSRLWMKLCSITDPWSIPLVSIFQMDFVPLTTALWTWHFRQFSVHLTICFCSLDSYQFVCEDNHYEWQCQKLYWSQDKHLLPSPHLPSSLVIVGGYQVVRCLIFPVLTTPSHHLALTMSRIEIAFVLSYHLPRHCNEAS